MMQEQKYILKTFDGGEFPIDRKKLAEKSIYFAALFEGNWGESKENSTSLQMSSRQMSRILDFVFGTATSVKKKDRSALAFWFPETPFFKVKKRLSIESLFKYTESVFSLCKVSGYCEKGRVFCNRGKYGCDSYGGFLVIQPGANNTFKKTVKSSKFIFEVFRDVMELEGLWLWMKCKLEGFSKLGQELLEEIGLVVIPIHDIIFSLTSSPFSSFMFDGPPNSFVVVCEKQDWSKNLCSSDKVIKICGDEEWALPHKVKAILRGFSVRKGMLVGDGFPEEC